jgi:hypothetical protein
MLIFVKIISSSTSSLPSILTTEYVGFDFIVNDQPIVDDQVMARVNVHHPGFVAIYNSSGFLLGYSSTMEEVGMSHNHKQVSFKIRSSTDVGVNHTIFVRIPLPFMGRTPQLSAKLYNDTNMNMMFEPGVTDLILTDENDIQAEEEFIITDTYLTTIIVSDQEVNTTNAKVYIDQVIVPGPAWLVIHINDSGLGAMIGRRHFPLKQGVNTDLYVDINEFVIVQEEAGTLPMELAVFAHLHWDNSEYRIFNKTLDTHLFSPAFDDPIIGNESARPFIITFKNEKNIPGFGLPIISLSLTFLVAILVSRRRKK